MANPRKCEVVPLLEAPHEAHLCIKHSNLYTLLSTNLFLEIRVALVLLNLAG